jgi:hypothetical protein
LSSPDALEAFQCTGIETRHKFQDYGFSIGIFVDEGDVGFAEFQEFVADIKKQFA